MDNDLDTPTPLPTLDANGVRLREGDHVLTTGCADTDDVGEVWSHGRGQVLVNWPVRAVGGYRYSQEWHPATDLRVMD